MKILICGGGNGGHVMCGLFASQGHEVSMLVSEECHVEKWKEALTKGITVYDKSTGNTCVGVPKSVSHQPADHVPDAEIIFVVLPAKYNHAMLKGMIPHLRNDPLVVSIEGGWWGHPQILLNSDEERPLSFHFCEVACLPWAAREIEYAKAVEILGPKEELDFAVSPSDRTTKTQSLLSQLMGMSFRPHYSLLGLSLSLCCNWIHPAIMWGHFHGWDGKPYTKDSVPQFYCDVSQETCDKVEMVEWEIKQLREALQKVCPNVDLSSMRTTKEYLEEFYGHQITDKSTLKTCLHTNPGYKGLLCPMIEEDGQFLPEWTSRYLESDIPYGMLVFKGVSQLIGLDTPSVDMLIEWGQSKLSKEWIKDGKLVNSSLANTSAPQRYQCTTLSKFLRMINVD